MIAAVVFAVLVLLGLMASVLEVAQPQAAPPEAQTQPQAAPQAGPPAPAVPYTGSATGCVVDDPTSKGCLTGPTAHGLEEIARAFGGYRRGPKILSAGCWDKHAWNPSSDHSKGRGCDFFFGPAGQFPVGAPRDAGWELAHWLRANAETLRISYVIWQGRIWFAGKGDTASGWGEPYTGGGVYDATDATGGHFDHVHASFRK